MASERPFLAGAAMGSVCVGSGRLELCQILGSCATFRHACPTAGRRKTASWVTPSSQSKARHTKRRKLANGCDVAVGHSRPETGLRARILRTQLEINAKIEVPLPIKKNQENLEALAHVMDSPGGIVRHHEMRRIVGKKLGGWPVSCPS